MDRTFRAPGPNGNGITPLVQAQPRPLLPIAWLDRAISFLAPAHSVRQRFLVFNLCVTPSPGQEGYEKRDDSIEKNYRYAHGAARLRWMRAELGR